MLITGSQCLRRREIEVDLTGGLANKVCHGKDKIKDEEHSGPNQKPHGLKPDLRLHEVSKCKCKTYFSQPSVTLTISSVVRNHQRALS
jgi:hypothetical protein